MALLVLITLIFCAFSDTSFSSTANKRVYKVIDSDGTVRTIGYSGQNVYEKCKDDYGDWWETFDGGKTFRKYGIVHIKEDGQDVTLRDVSGAETLFTDDAGELYDRVGDTVTKISDK